MNTNMNYKPEDFSPIHYYPEVPTKKGWYISTHSELILLHEGKLPLPTSTSSINIWYWTGERWTTNDVGFYPAGIQDRNWFGLKEEFSNEL